jgi:hypothetical protein
MENPVLSLSYDFSLHIISLYRYLIKEQNIYMATAVVQPHSVYWFAG